MALLEALEHLRRASAGHAANDRERLIVTQLTAKVQTLDKFYHGLAVYVQGATRPRTKPHKSPIETVEHELNDAAESLQDESILRNLKALAARNPKGALLSMLDLRGMVQHELGLSKGAFDEAMLRLLREHRLTMHHHDFPGSMTEAQLHELVYDKRGRDGGTYYHAVAPR